MFSWVGSSHFVDIGMGLKDDKMDDWSYTIGENDTGFTIALWWHDIGC